MTPPTRQLRYLYDFAGDPRQQTRARKAWRTHSGARNCGASFELVGTKMQDLLIRPVNTGFARRPRGAMTNISMMASACRFSEVGAFLRCAEPINSGFAYDVGGYSTTAAQGKTIYGRVNTIVCCKTVVTMAPSATPVLIFVSQQRRLLEGGRSWIDVRGCCSELPRPRL